jgi:protein-disulfide isomerase
MRMRKEIAMYKRTPFWVACFMIGTIFFSSPQGFAQQDKAAQLAIATVKAQMRLPRDVEVKFVEKRESAIRDFLAVKLILFAPDREIPLVVYVDKGLEKVIIGNLFIKGENVTRKEAGEPKPRKIDMGLLEIEKSPARGPVSAKVAIVEFANFECHYCVKSWARMKEMLEKYPQDIRYVFKNFPLQPQGNPFDLSAMVASVQEVSPETFWLVHDYLYTDEGQASIKEGYESAKQKVEQILKEKGYDVQAFQNALETGKGKKRVQEDLAVGNRIRVRGTPTGIINGSIILGGVSEKMLEEQLNKK